MIEPHYPHIIISFAYRGCQIEIDRDELEGGFMYYAWVNHSRGCAVAVTNAIKPKDAIEKAKQWIDKRLARQDYSSSRISEIHLG